MRRKLLIHFFSAILIVFLQSYIPVIYFSNLNFSPDIILVYLVFIGMIYGRFYTILIGFSLGIFQDFITQSSIIGLFSLLKSMMGYSLGTLLLYKNIWDIRTKLVFVFFNFIIHFFIYFYVVMNHLSDWNNLIIYTLVQSTITFIIFWLFNRIIFNSRFL